MFEINGGDTLTLLSDGVVEARNKIGEEFGFERTKALSNGSAHDLAAAARHFGQEDDITVVKVTLTPIVICTTGYPLAKQDRQQRPKADREELSSSVAPPSRDAARSHLLRDPCF
jgi:hypothetical protein